MRSRRPGTVTPAVERGKRSHESRPAAMSAATSSAPSLCSSPSAAWPWLGTLRRAPRPFSRAIHTMLAATFAVLWSASLPAGAEAIEQKLIASDGARTTGSRPRSRSTATRRRRRPGDDEARGAVYVYRDRETPGPDREADGLRRRRRRRPRPARLRSTATRSSPRPPRTTLRHRAGAVYTFARTGAAARTETAKLTLADGAESDYLGTRSRSTATRSSPAPRGDRRREHRPGLRLHLRPHGAAARNETGRLLASDGAPNDHLGGRSRSTATRSSPARSVVDEGANNDEAPSTPSPAPGRGEDRDRQADRSDGVGIECLGNSVAIDGDTIVAGTAGRRRANRSGLRLYVCPRRGPARTKTAKLTASDGAAATCSAESVAIEGDTIVAGATSTPWARTRTGLRLHLRPQRSGGAHRDRKLGASDGAAGDDFGASVAIEGDTIVAGARRRRRIRPRAGLRHGLRSGSNARPMLGGRGHAGKISPARRDLFETSRSTGPRTQRRPAELRIDRVTRTSRSPDG